MICIANNGAMQATQDTHHAIQIVVFTLHICVLLFKLTQITSHRMNS